MSNIKKNLAANFAGSFWITLMNLAFIPLYMKFLGVESYGLIGIFSTIQAVSGILDMGLSATITREMARLSALPGKGREMRDLVRSIEVIYWSVALGIALAVCLLAPLIAKHWLNASKLSPEQIRAALMLMGAAVAFQWPSALYSGGLTGLQSQILLNAVNMVMNTLRGLGAVLVLWLVSATIEAFFCWQIFVYSANTLVLACYLWRRLPPAVERASFRREMLAGVWKFAAGMTGISVVATVLTQMDKVILSRLLPLEVFGYYTLAGVIATSLYRVIGPVFSAVYPRFVQLVAVDDQAGLRVLYHKSCQLMSVLILPVTATIACFSYQVLLLWTRNETTAENCWVIVSVLITGTAMNGLMNVPYALQLANGWTRLALCTNIIAIVLLVPAIILMANRYGAVGGASAWVILNGGYILLCSHVMHRRLLSLEKWRWYRQDVFYPLVTSVLVAGAGRALMPAQMPQILETFYIAVVLAATLLSASLAAPAIREELFARSWKIKKACADL